MNRSTISVVALATVLVGCGGGGSNSSSGGQTFSVGPVTAQGVVSGSTVVTNSADWSAVGFKGTFTSVRIKSNQASPSALRFLGAFTDGQTYGNLGFVGLGSTSPDYIKGPSFPVTPTLTPDGKTIVYTDILSVTPATTAKIKKCNIDGTGVTGLTTPPANMIDAYPSVTPDGTKAAFLRYANTFDNYTICKVTLSSGATSAPLVTDIDSIYHPNFSLDGKFLYFCAKQGGTDFQAWKVPAAGGTPVSAYAIAAEDVQDYVDAPNNDGQVAVVWTGTATEVRAVNAGSRLLYSTTGSAQFLTPVPNTPLISFIVSEGGTNFIEVVNIVTGDQTKIWESSQGLLGFTVLPPSFDHVLAGTGGDFGASLHGLVFTKQDKLVESLVGFRAVTPSTVQLSSLTGDNTTGPDLDFQVTADTLKYLAYEDTDIATPIVAIGTSPATATGAFISLSAKDGKVSAIIPFTGTSAANSFKRDGPTRTFQGTFIGVFDAKGKNLAPAGAAHVTVSGDKVTVQR
jgi:hypothetical protein